MSPAPVGCGSEKVKHAVRVNGFQAEIDPNRDTGGFYYETGGRAVITKP